MDLKDKINKIINSDELQRESFAVEVYKRKYEVKPVWKITPDKSILESYEILDENETILFTIPTNTHLSKYDIENQIAKKLKSSLNKNADNINYEPAVNQIKQITTENNGYDLHSVKYQVCKTNNKYHAKIKRQVIKAFDSEDSARTFVDNCKSLMRDNFSSIKMSNMFDLDIDKNGKYQVHMTQDILKMFLNENDAYEFIDSYKKIIREASNKMENLKVEGSEYTDFVAQWYKEHADAKPGNDTMKQIAEEWKAKKKSSLSQLFKIYAFVDRLTILKATEIWDKTGVNYKIDESNNSAEIEIINKRDSNKIDAMLNNANLKFDASELYEGEPISYITDEIIEKPIQAKIERKASAQSMLQQKRIENLANTDNITTFKNIYRFADNKAFYKACSLLNNKNVLYIADDENTSLGVVDASDVETILKRADIEFTKTNDLLINNVSYLAREAKVMMTSEFDTSKGCWRLEDLPDGTLGFIRVKPLRSRIDDAMNNTKMANSNNIKVMATKTMCDLGDSTVEIRILSRDPDNNANVVVQTLDDNKRFSTNIENLFPII